MNSYSWYQDRIRDHFHSTLYKGLIEHAHLSGLSLNSACGDRIHVTAKLENNHIVDIKFMGEGCVISQAAASLLAEQVKHKTLADAHNLSAADMQKLLGIELGPVRLRCALLALEALHKGIAEYARSCKTGQSV